MLLLCVKLTTLNEKLHIVLFSIYLLDIPHVDVRVYYAVISVADIKQKF